MHNLIELVNVAAAVLATYRLTEMFLIDKIMEPLRKKFSKTYLINCARCVSVWSALIATVAFFWFAPLNYVLALSWLYITHNDAIYQRRIKFQGRELIVRIPPSEDRMNIVRSEFSSEEVKKLLVNIVNSSTPSAIEKI